MYRLHRSDNIQFSQTSGILRVDGLDVFDAVTQGREAAFVLIGAQPGETFQDLVHSPVTDGMDGQTEATFCRQAAMLEELFAV
jgi:hypothetical protein